MKDQRKQSTRTICSLAATLLTVCSLYSQSTDPDSLRCRPVQFPVQAEFSLGQKTVKPLPYSWHNYDYFDSYMGRFCQVEHRLSNAARMPVRMRLGNLQLVDALEMKIPAYRLIMLESR